MNLIDAGLFIYFPRNPGHNIYFKVFDGQDIYLKNCQPPFRISCSSHKKGDQFQSFPNRTDCHTKHIAMFHGLWPSFGLKYICKIKFPLVINNLKHFQVDFFL